MAKLKCWKKVSPTHYKRVTGQKLYVDKFKKGAIVMVAPKDEDKASLIKNFKNKPKAESFANQYMKKHDKC